MINLGGAIAHTKKYGICSFQSEILQFTKTIILSWGVCILAGFQLRITCGKLQTVASRKISSVNTNTVKIAWTMNNKGYY